MERKAQAGRPPYSSANLNGNKGP